MLVAAATAYALPFRQPNCNTSAHYALVQTLAAGAKTIDRIHGESCDISWWHGHYYANKAPGLALVTTPWYAALRVVGVLRADTVAAASFPRAMRALPRRDLWLMGLWGAVLPALGLLVLLRSVAERLVPGTGVAVSATLAFASLLLPFSSLFFSHVLAAFLAFAAFALLFGAERAAWWRLGAAGLLAGFAVVVEYPSGLLMLALGAYVAAGRPRRRRVAAFAVGAVAGLAPLAAYNLWAFGSPLHLSYVGAVRIPGVSGHDVLGANSVGFYGVTVPDFARGLQVVFGSRGLLTLGPVLGLTPAGCVLLWRRGRRREVALIAALLISYLLYNAAYYSPLGGATPGPRFLIVVLPFAVLALAPAVRAWPLSLLSLALASAAILLAAHLTQPLISPPYQTRDWWHWLRSDSLTSTILSPSTHGWPPAILIAVGALAAAAAAMASVVRVDRVDLATAALSVISWLTAFVSFPHLARSLPGAIAITATIAAIALLARRGAAGAVIMLVVGAAIVAVHRHDLLSAGAGLAGLAATLSLSARGWIQARAHPR